MSGLVAIVGPTPDAAVVDAMLGRLAHRGGHPTVYVGSDVAIGHVHRPTTPEAPGEHHATALPGGLVAAADARLDNRPELIAGLDGVDASATDLDLIVAAYRRWGLRTAEHLIGDFAFAIWDPARGSVIGARDHFGARPLYWARSADGAVCIGSEPRALFGHPAVDQHLDPSYVRSMLGIDARSVDAAASAFEGVRRVPPATMFVATRAGLDLHSYWSLENVEELTLDRGAAVEGFREVLSEAVECRLRTEGKVASHLSGGLDSSTVTAVAAAHGSSGLLAVTNAFPDLPQSDETHYARLVTDHLGIDHDVFRADGRGPLDVLDDVVSVLNEPYIGSNHHLVWGLSAAAAAGGATVVLDGFDGDSVISHGYGYLRELGAARSWATLAVEASALADRRGTDVAQAVRSAASPAIEGLIRRGRLWSAGRGVVELARSSPLSAARLGGGAARRAWAGRARGGSAGGAAFGDARAEHIAGLAPAGLARTLEWLDLYANHHGVEARHPFIDKRVVEFCVGLPAAYKLTDGYDRWVARQAMEGLLPRAVQWRTDKTDMNANFVRGLFELDRDRVMAVLTEDLNVLGDLIDVADFSGKVAPLLAERPPSLRSADALQVWRVVSTAYTLARRWPDARLG